MTEVFVFLIVGGIAILSAAMMLLSRNAVHSALYLVLNFVCVAFFFLTLGAPFIAIAQIAVYAGAIMVLFLFVIMLLGADLLAPSPGPFRWLPRAAVVLALLFLLTTGWALVSGEINLNAPPASMPQVRVIHAADAPPVDVYLNNQLIFEDVNFRAVTKYHSLPAGEYGVTIFPAGADPATESPAILGDLTLAPDDVATVVALGGNGVFQITRLYDQPGPVPDNKLRLTMLNGLPDAGAVDLVDPGVASDPNDSRVLIGGARFGETVETVSLDAVQNLTLEVLPAGNLTADPLVTYRGLTLDRNTDNLLIVAPETLADGQVRDVPLKITTPTAPLYGSPQQIGQVLFTKYLLPFQMVAVLLLVAMIGAITLTHRELMSERRPRRPVVRRPLVGAHSTSALLVDPEDREAMLAGPDAAPEADTGK